MNNGCNSYALSRIYAVYSSYSVSTWLCSSWVREYPLIPPRGWLMTLLLYCLNVVLLIVRVGRGRLCSSFYAITLMIRILIALPLHIETIVAAAVITPTVIVHFEWHRSWLPWGLFCPTERGSDAFPWNGLNGSRAFHDISKVYGLTLIIIKFLLYPFVVLPNGTTSHVRQNHASQSGLPLQYKPNTNEYTAHRTCQTIAKNSKDVLALYIHLIRRYHHWSIRPTQSHTSSQNTQRCCVTDDYHVGTKSWYNCNIVNKFQKARQVRQVFALEEVEERLCQFLFILDSSLRHLPWKRTQERLAGGLNSINIVISNPAKTAAWVPTVTEKKLS